MIKNGKVRMQSKNLKILTWKEPQLRELISDALLYEVIFQKLGSVLK